VDDSAVARGMPTSDKWHEVFFGNATDTSWLARMGAPQHLREGLANIPLPLAADGENSIIARSGWGDGHYPSLAGMVPTAHWSRYILI
jgi:hypothetical protein